MQPSKNVLSSVSSLRFFSFAIPTIYNAACSHEYSHSLIFHSVLLYFRSLLPFCRISKPHSFIFFSFSFIVGILFHPPINYTRLKKEKNAPSPFTQLEFNFLLRFLLDLNIPKMCSCSPVMGFMNKFKLEMHSQAAQIMTIFHLIVFHMF